MSKPKEKMLFGVCYDNALNKPIVVLGIPRQAWEYMRDGKTHTFDLTKAGINVGLVIFGCATHDAGLKIITDYMESQGLKVEDRRGEDFSI